MLCGEVFILSHEVANVLPELRQATAEAQGLNWRIRDLVLAVVEEQPA